MTNFVPIFPLGIIVYPGEILNLHVFEPRYKQLAKECVDQQKSFGIPCVINKELKEIGTLVNIIAVEKEYNNGKMDIRTQGERVFRMLEVIKEIPDKMYSGAIVNYPEHTNKGNLRIKRKVIQAMRELHHILGVHKQFNKPDDALTSYDIAHHIGLSLEEEYELLKLPHELQRQEYLKRHLTKVIPMMAEMENLKERVKLNGHFRKLSAGNF